MHVSMNQVSIGLDNSLSPIQRQAIILTNAGLLSIGPIGKTSMKFESKYKTYHSWKCI